MTYLPEIQLLRIGFPVPVSKGEIVFKYPDKKGLDFSVPIQQLTRFDFSTEKLKEGKWEIKATWTDGSSRYFLEGEVLI
jgi:nitrogen fixation protein FixH